MFEMSCEGDILTIKLNVNREAPVSNSGKSKMLGTTGGFQAVATPYGVVRVSINAIVSINDTWTGGGKVVGKQAAPTLVKRA